MDLKSHQVGNYKFVVIDNKYVYCDLLTSTDQEIIDNLLFNFENFKKMYNNSKRAYGKVLRCINAKKRLGWKDYKFEYNQISLLEDMGFEINLPLRDGCGNRVKLEMHRWRETDEGVYYAVGVFGGWSGTVIHNPEEETIREFFERFIGEVFYFTTVAEENYFPFVYDVRSQFNFRPAVHIV